MGTVPLPFAVRPEREPLIRATAQDVCRAFLALDAPRAEERILTALAKVLQDEGAWVTPTRADEATLRDWIHLLIREVVAPVAPGPGETTDNEISTEEAAAILHVSRPFVVKLIDSGELPARKVGRYRRLSRRDVEHYREAHCEHRAALVRQSEVAWDELARLEREALAAQDASENIAS